MAYIEFRNIEKFYGSNQVLKGIDLKIEKGQFVTLLGPSGCGKSTLLRCLAGLEEVNGGRIFLDGEDITDKEPKERTIGMVFQQYSLFPNMTVEENIAFGLKLKKMEPAAIREKVAGAIKMVELNGKEKQHPASLSGGGSSREWRLPGALSWNLRSCFWMSRLVRLTRSCVNPCKSASSRLQRSWGSPQYS